MSTPPFPHEEFIRLLHLKDKEAFSHLYDIYSPALFGTIYKMINDPEKAARVLQFVFARIWREIPAYSNKQSGLLTWMLLITWKETLLHTKNKQFIPDQDLPLKTRVRRALSARGVTFPEADGLTSTVSDYSN